RDPRPRLLGPRHEELRRWSVEQSVLLDVADDTDDHRLVHVMTDGVAGGKVLPCKGLVDHHRPRGAVVVGRRERSTGDEAEPERAEIAGRGDRTRDHRQMAAAPIVSLDVRLELRAAADDRRTIRRTGRADAGQGGEPAVDFSNEACSRIRTVVPRTL